MPRIDEGAAIRKAEAQGVRVTKIPPRSYMMEGPAGRFLWDGLGIGDEAFAHEALGTLNISKAWELIPQGAKPRKLPIEPALLESASGTDLNEDVLSEMTLARLDDPVLFITDARGQTFLIDGAHRLHRRALMKMKWVYGFVLTAEVLPLIRGQVWKIEDDGSRTPFNINGYVLGG